MNQAIAVDRVLDAVALGAFEGVHHRHGRHRGTVFGRGKGDESASWARSERPRSIVDEDDRSVRRRHAGRTESNVAPRRRRPVRDPAPRSISHSAERSDVDLVGTVTRTIDRTDSARAIASTDQASNGRSSSGSVSLSIPPMRELDPAATITASANRPSIAARLPARTRRSVGCQRRDTTGRLSVDGCSFARYIQSIPGSR